MLADYIIFTRQPTSKVPTYLMEFKVFIMHTFSCREYLHVLKMMITPAKVDLHTKSPLQSLTTFIKT